MLLLPAQSKNCTTIGVDEAYKRSVAVFVGKITSVESNIKEYVAKDINFRREYKDTTLHFDVSNIWKGDRQRASSIRYWHESLDEEIALKKGKEYIVFLQPEKCGDDKDQRRLMTKCTPVIDSASEQGVRLRTYLDSKKQTQLGREQ